MAMRVEQRPGAGREPYSCLEAVARLLCGMSGWFRADIRDEEERGAREHMLALARLAIARQTDPASPDFADYVTYSQPRSQLLVDTAFLAQALLRAPAALWDPLPESTKAHVIALLEAMRKIEPCDNNWLLFSVEVELLYRKLTGIREEARENTLRGYLARMERWYVGGGWYSDGPKFAMDYYNSLVIYPFLLDVCAHAPELLPVGCTPALILQRARRHAELLARLAAPDGTYAPMGRSLAYRCGVFHLPALLAWRGWLPDSLPPAAVRALLCAVTKRTLGERSYRADGFLNIGICRSQPEIGEGYISTGSLYLASAAFLPLGLAEGDAFWAVGAES